MKICNLEKFKTLWDFNKNIDLDFYTLTHGSKKKAIWKCNKEHTWEATINNIYHQKGCPYCAGKKVCEDNCLEKTHLKLCKEWSHKNTITPKEVTYGSSKLILWECLCGKEWSEKVNNRTIGYGCPYCSSHRISREKSIIDDDFFMSCWSDKNILKPENVFKNGRSLVWWKCKKEHEWKSRVFDFSRGHGCPYCSGKKVCENNCLEKTHPKLCKEWSNKNSITPKEVTHGSHKKILWKCKKDHEWVCSVNSRTNNRTGCPTCLESKGEKKIKNVLEKYNISYKREYIFLELKRKRFDFVVFDETNKMFAVIEYHGIQHYNPILFWGIKNKIDAEKRLKSIKKSDKIKKDFINKVKLKYIEIKYTEYHKIEDIIKEKLK